MATAATSLGVGVGMCVLDVGCAWHGRAVVSVFDGRLAHMACWRIVGLVIDADCTAREK